MVHYTCDGCKRPLDDHNELRYVVKIEIFAAVDPMDLDDQEDRDNLDELHDMLEGADESRVNELDNAVFQQQRFDLCPECRKRFLKNPLGRKSTELFDFSEN